MKIKKKNFQILINFFLILVFNLFYFNQTDKLHVRIDVKFDDRINISFKNLYRVQDIINEGLYDSNYTIYDYQPFDEFFSVISKKSDFIKMLNLNIKKNLLEKKINENQFSYNLLHKKKFKNYTEVLFDIFIFNLKVPMDYSKSIIHTVNLYQFLQQDQEYLDILKFFDNLETYYVSKNINLIKKFNKYIFHQQILKDNIFYKLEFENKLIAVMNNAYKNSFFEFNSYNYFLHVEPIEGTLKFVPLNKFMIEKYIKNTRYNFVFTEKKKFFNGYLKYLIIYIFFLVLLNIIFKEILVIYKIVNEYKK